MWRDIADAYAVAHEGFGFGTPPVRAGLTSPFFNGMSVWFEPEEMGKARILARKWLGHGLVIGAHGPAVGLRGGGDITSRRGTARARFRIVYAVSGHPASWHSNIVCRHSHRGRASSRAAAGRLESPG
jgi:hypothetical protein